MSAPFDIQRPATEIEIAEAVRWAADPDADVIRRLAFERDALRSIIDRQHAALVAVRKEVGGNYGDDVDGSEPWLTKPLMMAIDAAITQEHMR